MTIILADRLKSTRHEQFVGRNSELALFEWTLSGSEFPIFVLYVFGPAGIGKTTLINEFIYACDKDEVKTVYLDARDIEPLPDSFMRSLHDALQIPIEQSVNQFLETTNNRLVLMIDTYEALAPLENWLKTVFLPSLTSNVLTVLAGRNPPNSEWQSDSGWQGILRIIPLRNLSPKESRVLLGKRGIPAEDQSSVLGFTNGHPLALSLIADLFSQRGSLNFRLEDAPDVVEALLQRFIQDSLNSSQRAALEVCALVRMTTESILQALLELPKEQSETIHEMFNWLHSISFIESGTGGLFPHDLAREVFSADLRWRNPERWADLSGKARKYYSTRLQQLPSQEQQNTLMDYVYLHRNNPVLLPFYNQVQIAQAAGNSVMTDAYQPADRGLILEMVRKHEGETSARWAEFWLERQPHQMTIIREGSGSPVGFLFRLALHQASETDLDQDPGTRAIMNYIKNSRSLRAGETVTFFRFWMVQDSYQSISPMQVMIGINMVRHYLNTPGLALSFKAFAEPDYWLPSLSYAGFLRIPEADYEIDGRLYGVFFHDWRTTPPILWLEQLADQENSLLSQFGSPKVGESLIVLSHADFEEAVRKALKAINQPSDLQTNPLLRSRLVAERLDRSDANSDRALILASVIRDIVESMSENNKDLKFYRVLYHTFIQPAPTQEQVAQILNLPFPTYRYQLKIGLARVIEKLWQNEIGMS